MKKVLLALATIAVLIISTSAYNTKPTDSRIGYKAPNFIVSNADTTMSLQQLEGKYVLLTFWSSADAESRISNMRYDRIATANNSVQHLAVNFDRSEKIFSEIAKIDNLNSESQFFNQEDSDAKLRKIYRIDTKGYRTLLINPQGEVVSINPSESELSLLN